MNKEFLALRYEEYKRLAPGINGVLVTFLTASSVYGWLDPFIGPWAFPLIWGGIIGVGLTATWLYYQVLGMKHAEREAHRDLDPYQEGKLTPKEAKVLALIASQEWGALGEASRRGRV